MSHKVTWKMYLNLIVMWLNIMEQNFKEPWVKIVYLPPNIIAQSRSLIQQGKPFE